MAKCCICSRVKGKRKCGAFNGFVCSACCGTSRGKTTCAGCSFYKPASEKRRYEKTLYFSTHQMAESPQLEDAGNVMEGAMCGFDLAHDRMLKDGFYKNVTERLLDLYAFGDRELSFSDDLEKEGFLFIESAIHEDLDGLAPEVLAKIIGAVYRSVKRHANGNYGSREYIDFVHQHVGIRVAGGVRALTSE
jgi:hypothetical protein